ncbi:MAG: SUMF1/EgtB/PvdO family nonheme iron enzyme, partial [Candidatus Hydrogenedentota bacterium]
VVVGGQAAESARLSPKDSVPSVARAAATSIDPTHILDGYVFLWNQKYGLVLRLIELSNAGRIRVERVWAESSDDIPAKIEYLVRLLFSPPSRKESPQIPAAQRTGGEPEMGESEVPPVAAWLLRKHPEMVYVPGGEFSMGNNDDSDADNMPVDPSRREGVSRFVLLAAEKPEHVVNVKPFLIDKYEVTNAEYKKFKPTHNFAPEKASHPVTGVSWYDAQAYAAWAGKRLPTEQEWEKAARGTDGRKWPWGNIFRRGQCNLGTGTAPVGSFEGDKSAYGAYDMAGNVQEWTSSNFTAYPKNTWKHVNFDARKKVVRGSYYGGNDFLARCSMRFCALPGAPGVEPQGENYAFIGFRCAMDVD